jgi:hypothetical protein
MAQLSQDYPALSTLKSPSLKILHSKKKMSGESLQDSDTITIQPLIFVLASLCSFLTIASMFETDHGETKLLIL